MSAVEDRIVAMKFDNKQFEPAVKTTMSTLDRLKAALNFSGHGKGLNEIQNTANRFNLNGMANAVTGIGGKFSAMSAVALSAINNITSRAIDSGLRVAKAFTFEPVQQGFTEYETKLGSVQTILANTQASGAKLSDVNATLQELNEYSDKTIYNFGEMAKNIGTFTAAGVDLKTATGSIKGIANLAALSGSNSQQAGTAMYQLSQAISSGRVSLQDWNSVVNAGMGGTVFQRALAQTAERMGTLDKGAVKLTGKMKNATINGKSFRESITAKPGEKSWLTSDVLTKTLNQFTGDMTDAELASMGFSKAQIKSIQEQAKTATNAATQVKTFTQLMGTLKESAASGWAQTFETLVGDFEEAKGLFTEVNNVLGGAIGKSADARNKMLKDWKDMGGRTKLLEGLSNVFKAIVQVVTPIKEAFREIFPPTTGKQLFALTERFLEFTKNLKLGAGTIENIKRTAKGFFAILSIGVSIVKGVLNVVKGLFSFLAGGSGGFLEMTAGVGDFLVRLDQTIKKGDLVNKFFAKLGGYIKDPIGALKQLGGFLGSFLGGLDFKPIQIISTVLSRLRERMDIVGVVADKAGAAWDGFVNIIKKVATFLAPLVGAIKKAFTGVMDSIKEAFATGDFSGILDIINVALLGGIILMIRKFFKDGLKIDFGGGMLESIKGTFDTLTGSLKALQTQVQAKTLLMIAGAVALLALAVVMLAGIDSGKLTKSMTALAVGFGQLLGAMAILSAISGHAGFIKIPIIAASMILLAGAVILLTFAVKNLSELSWEELIKGLTGVGVIMGLIVLMAAGLDKSSGSILRAGLAMIPLAIGIRIMASAIQSFATMSWEEMAKGFTALAASLLIIAGAMNLMPKDMMTKAAGLLILSVALNAIALALQSMGGMSWEEIAKGLVTLAGALVIIAGALYLMSGTLTGSAALLVAASALAVLAPVLLVLSTMSWEGLAKGLVALAGSLLILAGGLTLMAGTLPGSAALVVAVAALTMFVPVLLALGSMSWGTILTGLGALAATFLVLGVAGLLLAPVIPAILGLGAALFLIGASVALVGVGLMAVATAFSIFVAAASAGLAVLGGMISMIPALMAAFAAGLVAFVVTLIAGAGKIVVAFTNLLSTLLQAIIILAPKVGVAMMVIIRTMVTVLVAAIPLLVSAGFKLLLAIMNGIKDNIGQIVVVAGLIIVRFLRGLAMVMPAITQAGANLIVKFLNGLSNNIGRIVTAGSNLIVKFLNGFANNIGRIVTAGSNLIVKFLNGIANNIGRIVTAGSNIIVKLLNGITNNMPRIAQAGVRLITTFLREVGNAGAKLADAGMKMIIRLVRGVAQAIRSNQSAMNAAGRSLASAIASGMTGGMSDKIGGIARKAASMAKSAISAAKSALGINSPSKEFFWLGKMTTKGYADALANTSLTDRAAFRVGNSAIEAVKESMKNMSGLLPDDASINPIITPVLDLTKISKDAAKIGGMLDQKAVSADLSYRQAMGISDQRASMAANVATAEPVVVEQNVKIEQNNHSPKPLDHAEIYRDTRSAINLAKEALKKP